MSVEDGEKLCSDCGEMKPLSSFWNRKDCRDGKAPYCKLCRQARINQSREKLYGSSRNYHLKHRYGITALVSNGATRVRTGASRAPTVTWAPDGTDNTSSMMSRPWSRRRPT